MFLLSYFINLTRRFWSCWRLVRGILCMRKNLNKKTVVAVAVRLAALKEKDTIDAYFCLRAFAVFCVLFTACFKFTFS